MTSLAFIVLVPLIGAVLARVIPTRDARVLRGLGIGCASFSIAGMLLATRTFAAYRRGFQLEINWAWITPIGARFHLGIDSISLCFVLLAALLALTVMLAPQAEDLSLEHLRKRVATLLALESGTLGVLTALDMLTLSIFWVLATAAFLVVIRSSSEKRHSRLLTTCLALPQSLALLGVLLIMYGTIHRLTGRWTLDYATWSSLLLPQTTQLLCLGLLGLALFAPFALVATGMRGNSAWPGASLILMALPIELCGYGFLRFGLPFFPSAWQLAAPVLVGVAVAAVVLGALLANRLAAPEVWAFRAWVAQFGFVLLGIVTATAQGVAGSLFQVLAQGLSCAGLYLILGALRRGDRVGQVKGLKLCLFVILLAAAGVPGLCDFAGEFLVVLGGWHAPAEWQHVQSPSLYIRPDIIAVIVAIAAVGFAVGFVRMLVRLAGGHAPAETGESHQLLRGERVAFAVVLAAMVGLGILPGKILKQFAPRVTSILSSAQARAADAQAHPESPARMLDPDARKAVGGVLRGFD